MYFVHLDTRYVHILGKNILFLKQQRSCLALPGVMFNELDYFVFLNIRISIKSGMSILTLMLITF